MDIVQLFFAILTFGFSAFGFYKFLEWVYLRYVKQRPKQKSFLIPKVDIKPGEVIYFGDELFSYVEWESVGDRKKITLVSLTIKEWARFRG